MDDDFADAPECALPSAQAVSERAAVTAATTTAEVF